ncbi:MAG: hypothetical protein AB202_00670 [Parcubacteria bacterium C7867-007]|nr:MAG: hypothetical protein AB202_00670 [Parcubacteria bacterium C7867-007]
MNVKEFSKAYFWPTKLRVLVFIVLSIYVTLSTLFLAPFMSKELAPQELTGLEQAGIVATYPAKVFAQSFIYISSHFLAEKVTLRELMEQPSNTGLPVTPNASIESATITQASPIGFATGAILESLTLYLLACLISFAQKPRKKTV